MYDIIGDIHGHAIELKNLLVKLGYKPINDIYQHPNGRQAIFVGDFIDRGPHIRDTLNMVKKMCDAGNAKAIMGNHEYNAICFHTPHIEKEGFFRAHSPKEIKQHIQTLEQFNGHEHEWEMYLDWFKTLPLFLEMPHFNVVHAYWDIANIDWIKKHYTAMDSAFLSKCCNKEDESLAYHVIEATLKGVEVTLPQGMQTMDKDGNGRSECRVKWWTPGGDRKTMNEVLIPCPEVLKNVPISQPEIYCKYEGSMPVFFGHYSLKYQPVIENPLAICTDYNITHGGSLVACRVDVVDHLLVKKLIF